MAAMSGVAGHPDPAPIIADPSNLHFLSPRAEYDKDVDRMGERTCRKTRDKSVNCGERPVVFRWHVPLFFNN
jgi:hypothetical protein